MSDPLPQVTPFLMFEGRAGEAMDFYVSVFEDAHIESVERYGPDGPGPEGSVVLAAFSIGGQRFFCIDSFVHHGFTFTPALSLHVVCASDEEIDSRFARLSEAARS